MKTLAKSCKKTTTIPLAGDLDLDLGITSIHPNPELVSDFSQDVVHVFVIMRYTAVVKSNVF